MAVDWLEIKAEYATTKTSYAKLSQKYGVSISAIKRKAAAEKWTANRTETEPIVYQKTVQKAASKVASKVSSKIAEEIVTKDLVIAELARLAFANGADFAKVVTKKTVCDPITGRETAIQAVELVNTDELPPDKRAAISGIKEGKFGIEVSTCDKVKALELLGKHLGMFDGKGGQPLSRENNLLDAIVASSEEDIDTDDLPEV